MTTRFEYACDTCTATRVVEFDPIRVGREWRDEDMPESVPCGWRGCTGKQERVDTKPTIIKNALLRRQVFTGCECSGYHAPYPFSLTCTSCVIGAIGNLTDMVAGLQQELREVKRGAVRTSEDSRGPSGPGEDPVRGSRDR